MPASRNRSDSAGAWESSPGKQSLVDLCNDAFLLIFHIHAGNDPGQPDALRREISMLLQELDSQGKRNGHSDEDVKAARYAVCALIDETILNSQWAYKASWADRPLQLEHFGEHMAGERFFSLLERIREKGERKVDLLEVFCVALLLGFQGKYKLRGHEELLNLTRTVASEINSYRGSPPLAPHWKIPEEPVERPPSTVPPWVWVTGLASLALVILVFIILKLWLGSDATEAARRMIL
jgi:type VI secretion system protein ImpK